MQACAVLSKSMSYAKSRNVIAVDASDSVIRTIKNKFKKKEEEEFKNMDADKQQKKYLKSHKVLTAEQAALLL